MSVVQYKFSCWALCILWFVFCILQRKSEKTKKKNVKKKYRFDKDLRSQLLTVIMRGSWREFFQSRSEINVPVLTLASVFRLVVHCTCIIIIIPFLFQWHWEYELEWSTGFLTRLKYLFCFLKYFAYRKI